MDNGELRAIFERLARMEQKQDDHFREICRNCAESVEFRKALEKRIRELENEHLDLVTKYQQEVGEPRRLLMQVSELMKQLNWQDVKEPPELVELYATLDQAIRSACRNRVLPHGEPSE